MAVFSLCAIEEAQADAAFDRQVASLGQIGQQAPADIANASLALRPQTFEERRTAASLKLAAGDAVLASGGDVALAQRVYDSAIADHEIVDGSGGSGLIEPLRHIGESLQGAGQWAASVPYLTTALAIMRSTFPRDANGGQDPAIRLVLDELADAAEHAGDKKEARRLRNEIDDLEREARRARGGSSSAGGLSIGIGIGLGGGSSGGGAPRHGRSHGIAPPPPPPPPSPPPIAFTDPQAAPPRAVTRSASKPNAANPFHVVPVFFQTTRKPKGNYNFGTERNDTGASTITTSGIAYVSVPNHRAIGSVPRPSVWQLDFSADPARHVILKDIEKIGSLSNFYSRIRGRLRESDRAEALVYIHGFNQSFEDGVDTAAVLGTDLEIDGAVLAYSWPSKKNAFYYQADVDEVGAAGNRKSLAAFLVGASGLGARRVYVVAHSLGNRLLLAAMNDAKRELAGNRPFDQIVFGSADVESSDFRQQVASLEGSARHMTLYAGATDRALLVSGLVHGGQRAGDISANVPSTRFMDVIDATLASQDLLGHDDYAYLARDDLRALIWFGTAPGNRCLLRSEPLPRWRYGPTASCTSVAFQLAAQYLRRAQTLKKAQAAIQADTPASANVSASDFALAKTILQRLGQ